MSEHFTKQELEALRQRVAAEISPYRMAHTDGVVGEIASLAALYVPEMTEALCAAALLHDITKEYSNEEQLALLAEQGIALRPDEAAAPKIWHAITAPAVIARDYPRFATDAVLSAVRWHTTGRAGMTLCEALLYLADYIEAGRRFADCVALREAFWSAEPQKMDADARLSHLYCVLLRSFDFTLADVEKAGRQPCLDTLAARQDIANRL